MPDPGRQELGTTPDPPSETQPDTPPSTPHGSALGRSQGQRQQRRRQTTLPPRPPRRAAESNHHLPRPRRTRTPPAHLPPLPHHHPAPSLHQPIPTLHLPAHGARRPLDARPGAPTPLPPLRLPDGAAPSPALGTVPLPAAQLERARRRLRRPVLSLHRLQGLPPPRVVRALRGCGAEVSEPRESPRRLQGVRAAYVHAGRGGRPV